jgi:hypothetical protein
MRLARTERPLLVFVLFSGLFMPSFAYAYVDPGTTGMLTQLLYILFYGALGVFLCSLRYIKRILLKAKRHILLKIFKGRTEDHDER